MKNITFEFYKSKHSINRTEQILVYLDHEIIATFNTFNKDILDQLCQIPFNYVNDDEEFMLNVVDKYHLTAKVK